MLGLTGLTGGTGLLGREWDPRSLPGVVLVLDAIWEAARRGFSIGDDAIALAQWSDDSGNGKHAVQATSAKQPVLDDDGARPVVRFDGVDDRLVTAAYASALATGTVLVAAKFSAEPAGGANYLHDGIVGTSRWALYRDNSTDKVAIFAGAGFPSTVTTATGSFRLHVVNVNGASSTIYRNGSAVGTGNAGAHTLTGSVIGANQGNSQFLQGDILAILVYSGVLSAADRARAEAWLNARYALGVL